MLVTSLFLFSAHKGWGPVLAFLPDLATNSVQGTHYVVDFNSVKCSSVMVSCQPPVYGCTVQYTVLTTKLLCAPVVAHITNWEIYLNFNSFILSIHNFIYSIKLFTFSWCDLYCRELNQNRLKKIEGLRFQGLGNLVSLRLRRNQLSELMDGAFWGLSRIETL